MGEETDPGSTNFVVVGARVGSEGGGFYLSIVTLVSFSKVKQLSIKSQEGVDYAIFIMAEGDC